MDSTPASILLVEDDEVNLLVAKHLLNRLGHLVTTATNGEEAIAAVRKQPFALILMDIEMPVMDGLEATRRLRSMPEGKDIPIVALTAHVLPEKLAEIKAAGLEDYLIKPFELPKFEAVLATYLSEGGQ